ncbi:coil containing protein [Vibrio phage 1.046.O._10N.286.52.E3]|nr:coil containing protein [Vibrio phage 1.046.O._10N.286.52.E3]
MNNTPKKSDYVPLLIDRLNIGESTAWLWLKVLNTVTDESIAKFKTVGDSVTHYSVSVSNLNKTLKSLKSRATCLEVEISECKETGSPRLQLTSDLIKVKSQIKASSKALTQENKFLSETKNELSELNQSNCQYLYRRVQAAITSERTDWTPITDVAGHLESQFGVTVKQVAEWFGYDPHSLYGIIGNGRFVEKRPKRALTLIDYYLKENELC